MTRDALEHIQTVCRDWLRQPDPSSECRLTIPPGGPLSRLVEIEINALLTFDNVLIRSAVDAETGANYTRLIRQPEGSDEFIDTPFELLPPVPAREPDLPTVLRPTQKRYQEAMAVLAESQREHVNESEALGTYSPWLEEQILDSDDEPPKYLVYAGADLLGYSLLERAGAARERRGRFYPSGDYYKYSHIFVALPDAENEAFEAAAKAAYGLVDDGMDESRMRFNELSAQADALELFVEKEAGQRMKVSEVRLLDLSLKYDDQAERWLYLTLDE